ncbi:MAG: pitrilysin family protein [Defluviitoga tunisiensis]
MYKHERLDNGLDVILVQRESMMSASILFGVKVGSAMENESIAGISHLIEHTVFRGTEKRNSVQIKNPIEEVGGELNAFTSKNFTVYFSKIPTTKVSEAIDILSGLVFEPKFRSEDIEREKSIILEEIASYEDDPGSIVIENLYQHIFDEDFARPVLGYRQTVTNINYDIIIDYYSKFYHPQNVYVVIVGKFNEDKVLNQLNSINWSKNNCSIKSELKSPEIKNEDIKIERTKKDLSSNYIVQGFIAPPKLSKDYYATLILNTFLGSGMSSLLFSKLREESALVYEVASHYEAYPLRGLLLFFALSNDEKIPLLLDKFEEIIIMIQNQNKIGKWFNYGKNRLIGQLTLSMENNLSVALTIFDLYVNYDKIITMEEFINQIEKTEIEDVIRVAKSISQSNKYISLLSPGI